MTGLLKQCTIIIPDNTMQKFLNYYLRTIGILNFVVFMLLILSLAFPWRFSQPLAPLWLGLWFLEGRWIDRKNFRWSRSIYPVLFLCLFTVLELISLSWSEDVANGLKEWECHWPILAVFFVALFGCNEHYKSYRLKSALIVGSLLSIVSYSVVCYQHYCTGTLETNPPYWYGSVWTLFGEGPIEILKSRSYYCLVLLMSLAFSVDVYRHFRTVYSPLTAGLTIGTADLLLVIAVLLTASRTALLLLPVVGIAMTMMNYRGKWRKHIGIGILLLSVVVTAFNLRYNTHFAATKNDLLQITKISEPAQTTLTEPRITIYSCALRHLKDTGWGGAGFGASNKKMVEYYHEDGIELGMYYQYSTHNRYLKVWIEMGIVGLMAILLILISAPYFHSGQTRKNVLCMCLVFGVSMLTENLLSTMGGLYTFFTLIALLQIAQREEDSLPLSHP